MTERKERKRIAMLRWKYLTILKQLKMVEKELLLAGIRTRVEDDN